MIISNSVTHLDKRLVRLLIVLATICFQSYAETVFEPSYSARGILKYQHINETNKIDYEQNWMFGIQEDSMGRWKMEVHTQMPIANLPLRSNEYISYDRTNIYSVLYSPDEVVMSKGAPAKLIAGDDKSPAQVSVGPYPEDYSVGGIIWLAFVGGRYLDAASDQMVFPDLIVASPRLDIAAWSCDFHYDLVKSANRPLIYSGQFILNTNYLPKRSIDCVQINDAESEDELENNENYLKQLRTLTNSDSLIRSTYQVDETNIVNGVFIPAKFHCDVFARESSMAHNHIEVVVTNLMPFGTANLMPQLDGLITVEDRRLRIKDKAHWRPFVLYNLDTSGWITDTNDPRILAAATKKIPNLRIVVAHRPLYYFYSVVLFVLLILAPLFILTFRRKSVKITPK